MRKKLIAIFFAILLISVAAFFILKNKKRPDTPPDNPPVDAPKNISYSILTTYPHDTSSFTQGLLIYNGQLYESTGDESGNGNKIMKVDLKTGKSLQSTSIERKKYFGEGITILRDTIYQLTWQQKVVFVYTLKDFKKVKEFPIATEGWGITTNGKELIVSDGSANLYYYDPSTFQLLKSQMVTESGSPSHNLNELEYIDGFIYSNQWQYPYILKIDPTTGKVVAKADLTEVRKLVLAKDPNADYLNGIAYDAATKKVYVTGKLWPDLYEIQFSQ